MRRGRVFILLAIILLLGVLAAYLVLRDGGTAAPPPEEPQPGQGQILGDMIYVIVAGQDISRGSTIPSEDDGGVRVTQMPKDLVVETMLVQADDPEALINLVVGHTARMDIARGVFITEAMITEEAGDLLGAGSDASLAIEPGMTAIAIPMSRLSGVAYALRPGDSIDVLITMLLVDLDTDFQTVLPNMVTPLVAPGGTEDFPAPFITSFVGVEIEDERPDPLPPVPYGKVETEQDLEQPLHLIPQEQQRPRLVSQRLVEQATVLHVGSFPLEEAAEVTILGPEADQGIGAPPPSQEEGAVEGPPPPDIITLIVSPQDALALNWAIKAGADLVLTLRAPNDVEITETTSVTLQYLLDNYDITVPTRLPYGLEPSLDAPIVPELPNDEPQDTEPR
jgi:pilus assembly protein CpaB